MRYLLFRFLLVLNLVLATSACSKGGSTTGKEIVDIIGTITEKVVEAATGNEAAGEVAEEIVEDIGNFVIATEDNDGVALCWSPCKPTELQLANTDIVSSQIPPQPATTTTGTANG